MGEADGAGLGGELEILGDFAAGRERAAVGSNVLKLAAQFDFLDEKSIAGGAIFRGLVWEMSFVAVGEFTGGSEDGGHKTSKGHYSSWILTAWIDCERRERDHGTQDSRRRSRYLL
jgi:hypothetical protein